MTDTPENIAQTVHEITRDLARPEMILGGNEEGFWPTIFAVPQGIRLEDVSAKVDAAREFPLRRKGKAALEDLASLTGWANRFKTEHSAIFARFDRQSAATLTAVSNYHPGGEDHLKAGWGDHSASYALKLSRQWEIWSKATREPLSRSDLSAFLDANALDILEPGPALLSEKVEGDAGEQKFRALAERIGGRWGKPGELLTLSRHFQVHEDAKVEVKGNADTGEATLIFTSEHKDGTGQPVRIPNLFLIGIPVFERGELWRLAVRFGYRRHGGDVRFTLAILEADEARERAFDEACAKVTAETGLPIFRGSAEQP